MPSVTRKSQSSRAQRRDDIRLRLLAAVERLLEDGSTFTEVSVERLVTEAEISRSTFYVYFEDKGDLLNALAEEAIEQLLEACSYWWQLPATATKDDVREAMRRIFAAFLPHAHLLAAVGETASYDANVRERFGALLGQVIDEVAKHIATGVQEGFVHPGLDPAGTAAWLTWMTERGLAMLVAPASKAASDRFLTALTDIVWSTLYAGTR